MAMRAIDSAEVDAYLDQVESATAYVNGGKGINLKAAPDSLRLAHELGATFKIDEALRRGEAKINSNLWWDFRLKQLQQQG